MQFLKFLSQELKGISESQYAYNQEGEDKFYELFEVPIHLEIYSSKIFCISVNSIIGTLMIAPIRCALNIFRKQAQIQFAYDFIIIMIMMIVIFNQVEFSHIYHGIRGQSNFKLYGLITILDIMDKCLSSISQNLQSQILKNIQNVNKYFFFNRNLILNISIYGIYLITHSLNLTAIMLIYNLQINSDISVMYQLIFLSSISSFKGSLFKKFTAQQYQILSNTDAKARAQKHFLIWILIIYNYYHKQVLNNDYLQKYGLLIMTDKLIESIKHLFLVKFNSIEPQILKMSNQNLTDFLCSIYQSMDNEEASDKLIFIQSLTQQDIFLIKTRLPDVNQKLSIKCECSTNPIIILIIALIIVPFFSKFHLLNYQNLIQIILLLLITKLFCSYVLYYISRSSRAHLLFTQNRNRLQSEKNKEI